MKIELTNKNYCGTIVEISNIIPLDNCDNVVHTSIMGNLVIVSKEVKTGDLGIYFPVECQLSKEYLSANNLYRKAELNKDVTKKGYFEENGRIRCVKFRGHDSEGLFMPLESLDFITSSYPELNVEFNNINSTEICKKYVVKYHNTPGTPGSKKNRDNMKKYESKLVDNQFRFHEDTSQLYRNMHRLFPESLIQVSYKIHGCVSENTIVNTSEGDFTIKEIVDNRRKVLIKAFDISKNQIVYVPIDDYYYLKDSGEWYRITLEDGTTLEITENNPIWLPELQCYRQIKDVKINDMVMLKK